MASGESLRERSNLVGKSGISRLNRRTRHKRGPVDPALEFLVGVEDRFEGERELGWAMRVDVRYAFLRLIDAWNVAGRNPPQCGIRARELLEPSLTSPE